jgi:polyphenol oxidase
MRPQWLTPEWPAPPNVRALATLRVGGVSEGDYASLNLATHVGDRADCVAQNRAALREAAQLPSEPLWLEQVHSAVVWSGTGPSHSPPTADAAVARDKGQICTIMTADCLPVIFSDTQGTVVAAAHAGWRGLAGGILRETIHAMAVPSRNVVAWLGPAIEQSAFEVGDEVRATFVARNQAHAAAFEANDRGRWQADIYRLARQELHALGVEGVYGGGFTVFADAQRFFSYRRNKVTGRMATMIWLA